MAARPPRDRCPECVGLPQVAPATWRVSDGEIRCGYMCPDSDCRHVWVTSWPLHVLGPEAAA